MRLCIVMPSVPGVSETFLRAHAELLPADVTTVHGTRARIAGSRITAGDRMKRWRIKAARRLTGKSRLWEISRRYRVSLGTLGPDAVLAEFGPMGVWAMEACREHSIPLIAHFHGSDANSLVIQADHKDTYPVLFKQASAIVAVSHALKEKLVTIGAPREKIHVNPCGVSCDQFVGADPSASPPVFLSVGRFVENKGAHFMLIAFAELLRKCPSARLRMIGDGPWLPFCRELAERLRLGENAIFLGAQPHDVVRNEMRSARALVHHSVVAATGESEGSPVVVAEACASQLPVIGSRVGGIPDLVLHGKTGLLVDPGDVADTAVCMQRLAEQPSLAASLGAEGRRHVQAHFSHERTIEKLWSIIQACVPQRGTDADQGGEKPLIAA